MSPWSSFQPASSACISSSLDGTDVLLPHETHQPAVRRRDSELSRLRSVMVLHARPIDLLRHPEFPFREREPTSAGTSGGLVGNRVDRVREPVEPARSWRECHSVAAGKLSFDVIWVGTSGWQYRDWGGGTFYPDRLPQRRGLEFYVTRFPTVEVNNTFYSLPKESTFEKWRDESPAGFLVTVKASRYITHIRRLRDARDSVDLFWSRARLLGERLGPVLFQLPPKFRADVGVLREFLMLLPTGEGMRAAFEFRDASWETSDVYETLDRAGAAWVVPDRPGWRVPFVVTGGWSYVRFHQGGHGPLGSEYSRDKLRRWADRIASLEVDDVFVYFNNDQGGAAVRDAAVFTELVA